MIRLGIYYTRESQLCLWRCMLVVILSTKQELKVLFKVLSLGLGIST